MIVLSKSTAQTTRGGPIIDCVPIGDRGAKLNDLVLKDSTQAIVQSFARTTEEVVTLKELKQRLDADQPMRIKYGVDATAPFLHIGHAVNLWMMRELQDHGHKVIFLIGDFTTRIGDPTGRSTTRPVIPPEEIERNAEAFIEQTSSILKTDDPSVFEIRRNSEWYGSMRVEEFLSLLSSVTHARLATRDMFRRRIDAGVEIRMHEFLYPVLQGYDSAMLQSDLTVVGTDQLFNEMMGRFFQERLGQAPQVVLTTRITPGTDGGEKQSKSLGNFIALNDTPRDKFGKVMSIPDDLIVPYLEVYTTVTTREIRTIKAGLADGPMNPRDAKLKLAQALVERYHGAATADAEHQWFMRTFSKRHTPEDIEMLAVDHCSMSVLRLLQCALPAESTSSLRRLVQQRAVRMDDEILDDPLGEVNLQDGDVLRVGKRRWFRISLRRPQDQSEHSAANSAAARSATMVQADGAEP